MGASPQYGDMWTSWWHRGMWVYPGYRGRVHHTLATAPTGKEWLGEVEAHHNGLVPYRGLGGSPGGGPHTPVSVPAVIALHGSS